jgi:DNA processing protein
MSAPTVSEATACAAALASLPAMTAGRLAVALRGRDPEQAWALVRRGWVPAELRPARGTDDLAGRWRSHAEAWPPDRVVAACGELGVVPLRPVDQPWGERLEGCDPPVSVLFAAGDPAAAARPCVALVGTRRATALGREVAGVLAADLARAGVAVVSGLAAGIDAAAHAGVLRAAAVDRPVAPPVAVVGCGLDVPYPRANAALWGEVVAAGVVLSEHPPGVGPQPHHFPLRNRIVAALASVVVVVESHRRGGALITADLAVDLGRTVAVVPGSLRNPAAEGTNALLRDGAVPVLDVTDVLVAAGIIDPSAVRGPTGGAADREPEAADPVEQLVLDGLGEGATVDELVHRTGAALGAVVDALDRLDERGILAPKGAHWYRVIRGRAW